MTVWPRSRAARTAIVLIAGLSVVQLAGLSIHTFDQLDLQRKSQEQDIGARVANVYRSVVLAPAEQREAALRDLDPASGLVATLDPVAPSSDLAPSSGELQRSIRISMQFTPIPPLLRWRELSIRGSPAQQRMVLGMRLPTGEWLNVQLRVPSFLQFASTAFLLAFALMTLGATALVLWAMSQFEAPMRELAEAADRLGRDVNAAPLPEVGSAESTRAAVAFNTMAARIRRFVQDRTFLLTAIGHDLRTPITRLKLRAEWMDDEEQRDKMLADLDEMEAMVAATLVFGRDDAAAEAPAAMDVAELLRTILDELSDTRPAMADRIGYDGPPHQVISVRPVAIKRALTNLVLNALNYGGSAQVSLRPPQNGAVAILVEDEGPGIPAGELERVFEPFHRIEGSRNRETGGTGLGLPIARNILRAHGGDVQLANRAMGGVRATVTLPT